MSKGSHYRPVDQKKWDENYDRIFNKTQETNDKAADNDKTPSDLTPVETDHWKASREHDEDFSDNSLDESGSGTEGYPICGEWDGEDDPF